MSDIHGEYEAFYHIMNNAAGVYHEKILDTIIDIDSADAFIEALSRLIKHLAVDHLHIVGDIYNRGPNADKIMDLLITHHSVDIKWGKHDILWMGAACGNEACIANVLRNNLKYDSIEILENTYAISLRSLTLFAEQTYPDMPPMEAALKAISVKGEQSPYCDRWRFLPHLSENNRYCRRYAHLQFSWYAPKSTPVI